MNIGQGTGLFLLDQRTIFQSVGTVASLAFGCSLLALVTVAFRIPVSLAQSIDFSVYNKVQAAYVYKIASLVSWPMDADASTFTICIIEPDGELSSDLRVMAEGRFIREMPIIVLDFNLNELRSISLQQRGCKMIYVNLDVADELLDTISASDKSGMPLLWVASPAVTSSSKALFVLVLEDGKIVIYLNKSLLADSQLVIAPPLLSVAKPR